MDLPRSGKLQGSAKAYSQLKLRQFDFPVSHLCVPNILAGLFGNITKTLIFFMLLTRNGEKYTLIYT